MTYTSVSRPLSVPRVGSLHTGPVHLETLILGAVATIGGAGLLVVAFRHGQAGRRDTERRTFRLAVGALTLGSLLIFATVVLTN